MIGWLIVIHVIAAAFWLGAALMMLFFVLPALRRAGVDTPKFMDAMSNGQHYRAWLQAAAGLTILTGLIAFYLVSGGFNAGFMMTTTGMLLSWGALAGIVAIVGVQLTFRSAPPRNILFLRITAALVTVALICMVLAVHG
jgi:uncharacterized membrane protein